MTTFQIKCSDRLLPTRKTAINIGKSIFCKSMNLSGIQIKKKNQHRTLKWIQPMTVSFQKADFQQDSALKTLCTLLMMDPSFPRESINHCSLTYLKKLSLPLHGTSQNWIICNAIKWSWTDSRLIAEGWLRIDIAMRNSPVLDFVCPDGGITSFQPLPCPKRTYNIFCRSQNEDILDQTKNRYYQQFRAGHLKDCLLTYWVPLLV